MKIGHLPYRFSFSFYDHPCVLSNRRGGFYLYDMIRRSRTTDRVTSILNDHIRLLDDPMELGVYVGICLHQDIEKVYEQFSINRTMIDSCAISLVRKGLIEIE